MYVKAVSRFQLRMPHCLIITSYHSTMNCTNLDIFQCRDFQYLLFALFSLFSVISHTMEGRVSRSIYSHQKAMLACPYSFEGLRPRDKRKGLFKVSLLSAELWGFLYLSMKPEPVPWMSGSNRMAQGSDSPPPRFE